MNSALDRNENLFEKIVPISHAEAMGSEIFNDGTMVIEFGFAKKLSNGKPSSIIIDVRKELSEEMMKDLYIKLKKYFEKD